MASRAVLQSTGDYLKSALRYSWFMDRRDDPAAPSEGWALRLTTELSGERTCQSLPAAVLFRLLNLQSFNVGSCECQPLPGCCVTWRLLLDCLANPVQGRHLSPSLLLHAVTAGLGPETQPRFVKQQVAAQWATPLTDLLSLSVTASAGVLLPWGSNAAGGAAGAAGAAAATCIADRFFLGGVSSLRGFKTNGVGPTDARRPRRVEPAPGEPAPPVPPPRRDALGGDAFASVLAAANLAVPHPLCEALGIHAQAFVNGGNAAQLAGGQRCPGRTGPGTGCAARFARSLGYLQLCVGIFLLRWYHKHVKAAPAGSGMLCMHAPYHCPRRQPAAVVCAGCMSIPQHARTAHIVPQHQ